MLKVPDFTIIEDMGTDAFTLIGDIVIRAAIPFVVIWAMIKAFEVLYDLWKWGQITEDRVIRRMAEKHVARMYGDKQAPTKTDNISKLLWTLIDNSNNGIIRLRWLRREEYGEKELRCIYANRTAGLLLGMTPDNLMECDSDEIVKLATSGMDNKDAERVLEKFRSAVQDGGKIDYEVQQRRSGPGKWLRMICEPSGEDVTSIFVDITDRKA